MKAAVSRAHGQPLAFEDVNLSEPMGTRMRVKIEACAICHSDIALIDGAWNGQLPAIFGHEAAGIVEAVGEDCATYVVGDHVLVTLISSCGECPCCNDGDPTSCHHAYDAPKAVLHDASGEPILQALTTAAFAEYVNVDVSQCHKIPRDLPFDVASLLSCGVITGVGAVKNTAGMKAGQTCIVIGAGGVGLNAIQGAKLIGAKKIIAMDINGQKSVGAVDFGATDFVLSGQNALEKIHKLTEGVGVNFVFVATGAAIAFETAASFLAPRGQVVMIGMPPAGTIIGYDPSNLAAMNQKLSGSRMGQTNLSRDIPWLLECYKRGDLQLDQLISNRFPFEQINEAIADTRKGNAKRNVVIFK